MKVLVVGSGGREHAITWKISKSPLVDDIFIAPGNGGTQNLGTNVNIKANEIDKLLKFAKENRIDLTIVGPEDPLVNGITDLFRENGLKIFGPDKKGAQLEGSKIFTKELLIENHIPTAEYMEFSDYDNAKKYIEEKGVPIVIKADGLAAGKGVTVALSFEEAENALRDIFINKKFGTAGEKLIIEEFLQGEEASYIVFTDGKNILPLASSQDHKRIYDNDKGPNTGGMGAYSPAPVIDKKMENKILKEIIEPTVKGMSIKGMPYQGILYAGIMVTEKGPKILEYNVRLGDPEAQPLLFRMKTDLVEIIIKLLEGKLDEVKIEWDNRPAVCIVMASGGYPGSYEKGKIISGIEEAQSDKNVFVFHAGTKFENGKLLTNGGRVLGVTAMGKDIPDAIQNAYNAVKKIHWEGAYYRTDIGKKALKHL